MIVQKSEKKEYESPGKFRIYCKKWACELSCEYLLNLKVLIENEEGIVLRFM